MGSDTEARKYFWLSKAEIASGELDRIAQSLPQNRVLALAGYASLGEIVSPPQPELSIGHGGCYYGIFPMIDYKCSPSAKNQIQVKKDLVERLAERFGIIVYTGNSYHYIGGSLMTHYLDVASFCGVQLQLNFPSQEVLMVDPRNIGHKLSTRKRPEGEIDFILGVPITVTHREDYRLNFVLRLTAGGIKQFEPRVVDVIYLPPIPFLRIVSD